MTADTRVCSRCGERKTVDDFYFVSKKLGTRRGHCKACTLELKAAQKDPNWRPMCSRCGAERIARVGPGRRLCAACFNESYDAENRRTNGSHRLALKPCSACGTKRLRADHEPNTSLCPVCRSVGQSRRKRLKSFFNMTPREFVELLEEQGNRCAICGRQFTASRLPALDHCHAGERLIRGALCGTCNSLIGLARDNVATLESAVAFLNDPPAQRMFPGRGATEEGNRTRGYTPLRRGRS